MSLLLYNYKEFIFQATLVAPIVAYTYVERWLELQIQKTVSQTSTEPCTLTSLAYLEWDALSCMLTPFKSPATC